MPTSQQISQLVGNTTALLTTLTEASEAVTQAATSVTTAVSTHTAQPDPHGQYVQELAEAEPVFATVDAQGRPQGMRLRDGQVVGGGGRLLQLSSEGRTRIAELLQTHTGIIHPDAGDRTTVGGTAWTVQANGQFWSFSGIDNSLNGFVKDGIPGVLERVPDTADTSSYTAPAAAFAWRMIVNTTHLVTEGAPRTQINGPNLQIGRRHIIEIDLRLQSDWNYTEQSESGLIFQLQQFDVNRRAITPGQDESPVVAINMTGLSARVDLHAYQPHEITYSGGRPQYGAADRGPWRSRTFALKRHRYTRIVIDYTPDGRTLEEGGIGHLNVLVDGQSIGEYRGPTLKPAPDGGELIPPVPKLAWYQWSTPGAAGSTCAAAGLTATRSLFVRKFRISEV